MSVCRAEQSGNSGRRRTGLVIALPVLAVSLFGMPNTAAYADRALDSSAVANAPRTNGVEYEGRAAGDGSVAPAPIPAQLSEALAADDVLSPSGVRSSLKLLVVVTVFSLVPSVLIMTTSFIRFIVVLGLLRQALGSPQLAPNQVIVALSLFMTFLVMTPVWTESYEQGVRPYTDPLPGHSVPSLQDATQRTLAPIRSFMAEQIESGGNSDAVWTFLQFQRNRTDGRTPPPLPTTYEQVPLSVLLPAFVVSELKSAFIIGFQIFLPFLVIDLVVSSVLVSMGMLMLPPTMVSLPLKLLLFVLIDGWSLTAEMLLRSVLGGI